MLQAFESRLTSFESHPGSAELQSTAKENITMPLKSDATRAAQRAVMPSL